jgi:hypothetical protein
MPLIPSVKASLSGLFPDVWLYPPSLLCSSHPNWKLTETNFNRTSTFTLHIHANPHIRACLTASQKLSSSTYHVLQAAVFPQIGAHNQQKKSGK